MGLAAAHLEVARSHTAFATQNQIEEKQSAQITYILPARRRHG